jgi:hypothetical protein
VILGRTAKGPSAAAFSRQGWEEARFPPATLCLAVVLVFFFCSRTIFAQDFSGADSLESKSAKAMVAFLFPEQISIPAQKQTTVDLHFRVADGLHINSHTPREKSLIPTNLAVVEQNGIKVAAVDFPPGTDYSFAFDPKEKLSVYTGDFVLRAHLTAPAGQYLLQGLLRYQACNSNSCYPPKTIPVAVDVIAK